ncbi:hypothetical protein [Microtetraspora malaysiensis]|uniref:Uncharacterized protein n=1 Tax=Microtetraspora malaysiensis TaxID=161358 RepID=A0ABW6SMP7_9ACTN
MPEEPPQLAVIVGSVRDGRLGPTVARTRLIGPAPDSTEHLSGGSFGGCSTSSHTIGG